MNCAAPLEAERFDFSFFQSIWCMDPSKNNSTYSRKTNEVVRQERLFLSIYGAWTLEKTLALIQEKQRKL
jgi:hypothetical protein